MEHSAAETEHRPDLHSLDLKIDNLIRRVATLEETVGVLEREVRDLFESEAADAS